MPTKEEILIDLEYVKKYASAIQDNIKTEKSIDISAFVLGILKSIRDLYCLQIYTKNPYYVHNCDICTFLGQFDTEDTKYDLYFCPAKSHPTIVARYGNCPENYHSGLAAICIPELQEAAKRAVEMGLLDPETKTGRSDETRVKNWIK